jgi:hypothetical protein
MNDTVDLYRELAGDLPNEVGIGGALVNLVEPFPGHELQYNRYYEDDHFYAGAMAGPWVISGRRWVATKSLLAGRYRPARPLIEPAWAGCYLATYLHMAGHTQDVARWGSVAMNEFLYPRGRGYTARENVFTAYSTFEFAVKRDSDTPLRPHHAFDYPFAGAVLEVLEPEHSRDRSEILSRLESSTLPHLVHDSPCSLILAVTPRALVPNPVIPNRRAVPGPGWNVTLLWLLDEDPRHLGLDFDAHACALARVHVELRFAGGFVPTVPGTNRYVDEIR